MTKNNMKKSLFRLSLVLATVLLVFSGCRKDKEYDEDLLIGSWNSSDNASYVFNEDHSGSRTKEGRTLTLTWRLDDDELELKLDGYGEGQSTIVTYKVYIIEKLTGTRMEAYDQADSFREMITFTKR